MVRITFSEIVLASALAAGVLVPFGIAAGAVDGQFQTLAEASPPPLRMLDDVADVVLRFVQEDGPGSGHVRVELTPEVRGLTVLEARSAAQQAFLEALSEPGLGDNLTQIKVVVRLAPASNPAASEEQTFLFLHKGGRNWSIIGGD